MLLSMSLKTVAISGYRNMITTNFNSQDPTTIKYFMNTILITRGYCIDIKFHDPKLSVSAFKTRSSSLS